MLKYDDVAEKIEHYIHQNQLSAGTQLKNIDALIHQYQVSRSTIIKALNKLERKGTIYQTQGSGIFVRQPKKSDYFSFIESHGFTRDLNNMPSTTKILQLDIIKPDSQLCQELQCDPSEDIYFIKRLRYVDNQIHCVEQSYYRKKMIPYINTEIASGSIFTYIKEVFNINIGFSDKYFEVNVLNEELAEYLSLPVNSPALFVNETFYTTAGDIFDFSKICYHFENTQFFLQSNTK
ncbi:GntR family transcriptional regulator [Utexia brackfieldae]|uniref:GntR family transcriptional regulator n=1 Tax=Utexia brackfieldae TaxID=3074108 RepID=UPI00370D2EFB